MVDNRPLGLYVHIPFCNKKCDYCDFVSFSMDEQSQAEYLTALCNEIDLIKHNFDDVTFDTLYLGGGTPSILLPDFITMLTEKLYSSFHFADYLEYTIEINPMSFTRSKFLEYVKCGINRLSIGVQCLNESVLKKVGRNQTNKSVVDTFKLINQSAFLNVSADVMIGLPGQTVDDVKRTLNFLIDNDVKHISVYTLQVEEGTKLYENIQNHKVKPLSDKAQVKLYNQIYETLSQAGFIRYELSNYCVPGYESYHNQKYWNDTQYLGIGVAAHSYIDGYRYSNVTDYSKYIALCKEGKSPVAAKEYITDKTRRTERIMLSLRTIHGLNLEKFKEDFNEDLLRSKAEQIKQLANLNMIVIENGYLKIAKDKFNVSNSIILELI